MVNEYVDDLVNQVKTIVERSTATAFMTPDKEDRYFLPEPFFTGVIMAIIISYFCGLLGIQDAGARHRLAVGKLLENLRQGFLSQSDDEEGRRIIQDTLMESKSFNSPERKDAAENEVQQLLLEYGESETLAKEKASMITELIFNGSN